MVPVPLFGCWVQPCHGSKGDSPSPGSICHGQVIFLPQLLQDGMPTLPGVAGLAVLPGCVIASRSHGLLYLKFVRSLCHVKHEASRIQFSDTCSDDNNLMVGPDPISKNLRGMSHLSTIDIIDSKRLKPQRVIA